MNSDSRLKYSTYPSPSHNCLCCLRTCHLSRTVNIPPPECPDLQLPGTVVPKISHNVLLHSAYQQDTVHSRTGAQLSFMITDDLRAHAPSCLPAIIKSRNTQRKWEKKVHDTYWGNNLSSLQSNVLYSKWPRQGGKKNKIKCCVYLVFLIKINHTEGTDLYRLPLN